jgi:hypothetical protein
MHRQKDTCSRRRRWRPSSQVPRAARAIWARGLARQKADWKAQEAPYWSECGRRGSRPPCFHATEKRSRYLGHLRDDFADHFARLAGQDDAPRGGVARHPRRALTGRPSHRGARCHGIRNGEPDNECVRLAVLMSSTVLRLRAPGPVSSLPNIRNRGRTGSSASSTMGLRRRSRRGRCAARAARRSADRARAVRRRAPSTLRARRCRTQPRS